MNLTYEVSLILHKLGIHDYMDISSQMCGNVAEINKLEPYQVYCYRKCYKCGKEKPHSRYFLKIGVKEKNAIPFGESKYAKNPKNPKYNHK